MNPYPPYESDRDTPPPHIASITQPATAAPVMLENLRRHQRGEHLHDLIDRSMGY